MRATYNHQTLFTRNMYGLKTRRLPAQTLLLVAMLCVTLLFDARFSHASEVAAVQPITRSILERRPILGTNLEREVILVAFQPGVIAPPHHHTDAGFNYVIEGTAESGYGNETPKLYHAGETFLDQADVPHTVFMNPDKNKVLRFLIVASVQADKPYTIVP